MIKVNVVESVFVRPGLSNVGKDCSCSRSFLVPLVSQSSPTQRYPRVNKGLACEKKSEERKFVL